jgi:membrane protease YdiL (CAAX protease family)
VRELALRRLAPDGALGLIAGAVLFSAVVGVLWLLGSYHVVAVHPDTHWLLALVTVGLGAGIGEEIVCRGVLYRIVEEGLGSWIALLFSALFFGAAHLHNPGATLWAGLAIAIEAGILLGLIYLVTRSLWVCIGLHAAWNFVQGTVYGIPVSGTTADGWLVSTRSGPDWLSGGAFGAEASVVALVLCSLVSSALLAIALRRGNLVPPRWWR